MNITVFTFTILILYMASLKAVSFFAHRLSTNNSQDYFLAGRNVGLMALIGTTAASVFSTGTVVTSPGQFFEIGSSYLWLFFFVMTAVVMLPIFLKFWKVGKIKKYITAGQMLGYFYRSKKVQIVAAVIGVLSLMPSAAAQMVGIGKTFEALSGGIVSYPMGVSIVTAAIAIYLWWGGSRAVIWTDMIQGFIFASLLVLTATLTVNWAGGWGTVMNNLQTVHPEKAVFDIDLHFYEYVPIAVSFIFFPHVWQRAYMAKTAASLVKTVLVIAFLLVGLFFTTWVIGTSALALFPNGLSDGDNVLGAIFREYAPYLGAFVLVAAFSAGMSTIDSQLLSCGAIFTHDIKKVALKSRWIAQLGWRENFKFARFATLFLMFVIYFWSLTLQSTTVIDLIVLSMSMNIIFWPSVLALFFWKRSSALASVSSMVAGFAVFLMKKSELLGGYFPTELGASSWALIISFAVYGVVALCDRADRLEESRAELNSILA